MIMLKKIFLFYCRNLIIVTIIWILFGTDIKAILTTSNTYLVPSIITFVGLLFGLGIPLLLYNPNRKVIFLWSQIIATMVFCILIIKINFDDLEAEKEYQIRKDKPENIIK